MTHPTTSMYKRGAIIVFTDAIVHSYYNGQRFLSREVKKGDVGKIASRKKNGWLRVSLLGDKAGRVISVRSGDGGMIIACSSNGQNLSVVREVRALVAIATGALNGGGDPAPIESTPVPQSPEVEGPVCVPAPPHLLELFEARAQAPRWEQWEQLFGNAYRLLAQQQQTIEELEDKHSREVETLTAARDGNLIIYHAACEELGAARKELDELKQSLPELGESRHWCSSSDAKSWTETLKNDLDENWVETAREGPEQMSYVV